TAGISAQDVGGLPDPDPDPRFAMSDRTRSTMFPPISLSVSTPVVTAPVACWTTSRVTRLTRATGDWRARLAGRLAFFLAARRVAALRLTEAPFRAPPRFAPRLAPRFIALLRAAPRRFADRPDFFLAEDFLVAMVILPETKRRVHHSKIQARTVEPALLSADPDRTINYLRDPSSGLESITWAASSFLASSRFSAWSFYPRRSRSSGRQRSSS